MPVGAQTRYRAALLAAMNSTESVDELLQLLVCGVSTDDILGDEEFAQLLFEVCWELEPTREQAVSPLHVACHLK